MSRVAKRVIDLPAGVTVSVAANVVTVKGAKGTLSRIEDGKTIWKIDVGQALSAGVGANGKRESGG